MYHCRSYVFGKREANECPDPSSMCYLLLSILTDGPEAKVHPRAHPPMKIFPHKWYDQRTNGVSNIKWRMNNSV